MRRRGSVLRLPSLDPICGKATSGSEMFTGIVTALGEVKAVERREGLERLTIASPYDASGVAIGASIAHDGCCLTVVEATPEASGLRYVVEVAPESLALTTLGRLRT